MLYRPLCTMILRKALRSAGSHRIRLVSFFGGRKHQIGFMAAAHELHGGQREKPRLRVGCFHLMQHEPKGERDDHNLVITENKQSCTSCSMSSSLISTWTLTPLSSTSLVACSFTILKRRDLRIGAPGEFRKIAQISVAVGRLSTPQTTWLQSRLSLNTQFNWSYCILRSKTM